MYSLITINYSLVRVRLGIGMGGGMGKSGEGATWGSLVKKRYSSAWVLHSALTVPLQSPYSALMVFLHSAFTF